MVTVREKNDGDNVDVHVKHNADDSIDGLVITVLDRKGEAVFVNIVGRINPDQISKLAKSLVMRPTGKGLRAPARRRARRPLEELINTPLGELL